MFFPFLMWVITISRFHQLWQWMTLVKQNGNRKWERLPTQLTLFLLRILSLWFLISIYPSVNCNLIKLVRFGFWFVKSSVSHCRFRAFSNCRLCLHLRNLKRLLMLHLAVKIYSIHYEKHHNYKILVIWNSTLARNRKQGFGSKMCIREAPTIFTSYISFTNFHILSWSSPSHPLIMLAN